jgi:hypothetical protein
MSIAGDTQPRVPGFYSLSETVLSPRKSGIAWQTATLPGQLSQPTASGGGSFALIGGTASGGGAISIGGTASGGSSLTIGGGTASALNTIVLGGGTASAQGDICLSAYGLNPGSASGGGEPAISIGGAASSGTGALGIGRLVQAGSNSVCLGTDSRTGDSSVAIGATTGGSNPGARATGSSAIAIGRNTSASQTNTIAIGSGNTITGSGGASASAVTAIAIGFASSAGATAAISLGYASGVDFAGQINLCNGRFSTANDIGTSIIPLFMTTTTTGAVEMGTSQGSVTTTPAGRIACTNFSTYIFDVDIVARAVGSTGVAAYNLKFAANRDANAASFTISSVSKNVLYTIGTVTGWDVTVTADTTNGRPNISVTGAAATTIRWVGHAKMTKVATAS